MNSFIKKIVSVGISAVVAVSLSTGVFAAEYEDMPDDWRTTAIENAVKNGLIYGTSDTTISPDASITRAQMAAIIVRALGATKEADISMFDDVDSGKWYYHELAKAVYMQAFSGGGDNKMNPDGNITFEECFTVLSRVFGLDIKVDVEAVKEVLALFPDSEEISDWAVKYFGAIVSKGYWAGGESGMLTPKAYITRGEFAVVMDNLVSVYVSEPEDIPAITKGNILVRCDGANLDGLELEGDLIIGDAVSANAVSLKDVNIKGRLVFRGCALENVKDKNDEEITVSDSVEETISCEPTGYAEKIQLLAPYVYCSVGNIEYASLYGVKYAKVFMGTINV